MTYEPISDVVKPRCVSIFEVPTTTKYTTIVPTVSVNRNKLINMLMITRMLQTGSFLISVGVKLCRTVALHSQTKKVQKLSLGLYLFKRLHAYWYLSGTY